MKNLIFLSKAFVTMLTLLSGGLSAFAHDFYVNGIYYNYLDKTAKTVEVTYKGDYSSEYSNEYTGAVSIPSSVTYSGTTYSVTKIRNEAFEYCERLTSVTIGNSVTSIGNEAFYNCSGLTSVTIGNSVTSIGDKAFEYCERLTSVTIGNSVTSIGDYAFYNCSGLTSVTIGNSVTSIGNYAFYYCPGLTSITIPNSVTSIGDGAFLNTGWYNNQPDGILYLDNCCLGYKGNRPTGTLILNDGTRVIADYAFYRCTGLTSVTIPNSVTEIGSYAFEGCTGLTEVNISDLSAWCKIDFGNSCANPLYYAKKLKLNGTVITNLVIPNDITQIKKYAFYRCTGLTSVTIGNSVTSIDQWAFYNCDGLTSITIPNSVTEIGDDAFYGCSNLKFICNLSKLTLSKGSFSYGYLAYYASYVINAPNGFIDGDFVWNIADNINTLIAYCGNASELILPNNFNGETYVIGDYAFYNCDELTSVTIGNSVTEIGQWAFYNCDGLTSVTIPNSVTSIGEGAFYNCDGLTSVTIPNSVTSIGGSAFYGCDGLTSVTIPNSVTSIGDYAFRDCSGLTSVTIGNSVTSIGDYAFYGCSNLYSLTIGSSISSIPSNAFSVKPKKTIWLTNTPPSGYSNVAGTINYVANDQYSSLSNVEIYPYLSSIFEVEGIKYVPVSPSERTCDAIDCTYNPTDTIINISNSVSFKGIAMTVKEIKPYTCYGNSHIKECKIDYDGNIENYAFYNCIALENVIINVESISDYAFNGCSAIETITLGEGLETVGNSAFSGCNKLTEIVIPNSVTSLGGSAFYGCSSLASATIGNAVKNINASTFYNCKSLENIIIGTGVKSIGSWSFYSCSALPIIEIPKNVTSIGDYAFDNCSNLSDVIIEDRNTVLTLGSNGSSPMFSDCPLDSVYIGGDISYKTTSSYGYSPFYNNKTLRAVTITDKETEISDNEFYGCANLKYVSIGDGVENIGKYAFSGCSSLESFAFGSSMKTIGEEAFSDCTSLITLRSRAMTPPVCGTQALDDINKWTCELFVPRTSIQSYQTADQWKEFFFISEDAGMEDVLIDNIVVKIAVENGNISINGIENPHIEIYNINGKCIYSGNDTTIPVSDTGVYILRINGKSYKIVNK